MKRAPREKKEKKKKGGLPVCIICFVPLPWSEGPDAVSYKLLCCPPPIAWQTIPTLPAFFFSFNNPAGTCYLLIKAIRVPFHFETQLSILFISFRSATNQTWESAAATN